MRPLVFIGSCLPPAMIPGVSLAVILRQTLRGGRSHGVAATPRARALVAEMQERAYRLQLAADPEPEQREEGVDPARVTVPALVVCGGHDMPYFRDTARDLAARLPRATLTELDWAGHLLGLERPEEITRLIVGFLSA